MEGLEFFDEERMLNEMNNALDNDFDSGLVNSYEPSDYRFEFEGELDENDISKAKELYEVLIVDDFKGLEKHIWFEEVKYLGWSRYFDRFIKLHVVIAENYYTFCVVNKSFLKSNFKFIKDDWRISIEYLGIKINSKGEEYPFLSMSFKISKNNIK